MLAARGILQLSQQPTGLLKSIITTAILSSTHCLNEFNYFSYCHATRKTMRIHNYIRAYSRIRKRHILLHNDNYIVSTQNIFETCDIIAPQTPFCPWRLANLGGVD